MIRLRDPHDSSVAQLVFVSAFSHSLGHFSPSAPRRIQVSCQGSFPRQWSRRSRPGYSHLWTAPCWQGIFGRFCSAGRCCHLFGLFVRRSQMAAGHNALRRSGPGQKHAVAMLQWLKWGVLISGSTGWVHYSSVALSNLVSASRCPRVFQAACAAGATLGS